MRKMYNRKGWVKSLLFDLVLFILFLSLTACGEKKSAENEKNDGANQQTHADDKKNRVTGILPKDIVWLTNDSDPLFASPEAKKGGTLHMFIPSFPMTFRVVGPDSNSSFRSYFDSNNLSLILLHPNTENIMPSLATHWAFDKDKKTMYFKLNKNVRWSDGKPVTASDYTFALEFMRSKHIIAPWYNHHYTEEVDKVIVYDEYTIAVISTKVRPELYLWADISPKPRHFYGRLDKDFVKTFNWKIEPNTGPYQVSDYQKGKYVKFKRKKNWWAKDLRYNKNRFNVDKVMINVIRDYNVAWEYFKKGEVDFFRITFPTYWHDKSKTPVVENGYVHKVWFYNDTRQSPFGLYMNKDKEIFKDINLRYAFAHAINIEKVIKKVLHNDYFRLEQAFMGYGRYTNDEISTRRFNLAKVKFYMEKAGWKRGSDGIWEKGDMRYSVKVNYSSDTQTPRLVVIKEEAKKAGIELILQKMDGSASFKKTLEKKHDVVWMAWSTGFRPAYWQGYHSDNAHKTQTNNITNTDNPELDQLIITYRNSTDAEERIKYSKKIQQKIDDICVFVPSFMVPYCRFAYWRWWRFPEVPGTKNTDDLSDPFAEGLFWFDSKLYEETLGAKKAKKKFKQVVLINETFKMKAIQ